MKKRNALGVSAALLDLDGVLVQTRELHLAAWKQVFSDLSHADTPAGDLLGAVGWTPEYYDNYLDGRIAVEGIRALFEHLQEASSTDRRLPFIEQETIELLADVKRRRFDSLLRSNPPEAYPDALLLLEDLRQQHIPGAVVSSSRAAAKVVEMSLGNFDFAAILTGADLIRLGLPGKPDPAPYLEAARRVGVQPSTAMAVEDSPTGVQSASRARVGVVVGVDRGKRGDTLRTAGADLVVTDLSKVSYEIFLASSRE